MIPEKSNNERHRGGSHRLESSKSNIVSTFEGKRSSNFQRLASPETRGYLLCRKLISFYSLTCRKRRVKCDEGKPRCGQCWKGERACEYRTARPSVSSSSIIGGEIPEQRVRGVVVSPHETSDGLVFGDSPGGNGRSGEGSATSTSTQGLESNLFRVTSNANGGHHLLTSQTSPPESYIGQGPDSASVHEEQVNGSGISPLVQGYSFSASPGAAPFDWYHLLAQDALSNIEEYTLLANDSSWDFDPSRLLQPPHYGYTSSTPNPGTLEAPYSDFLSAIQPLL